MGTPRSGIIVRIPGRWIGLSVPRISNTLAPARMAGPAGMDPAVWCVTFRAPERPRTLADVDDGGVGVVSGRDPACGAETDAPLEGANAVEHRGVGEGGDALVPRWPVKAGACKDTLDDHHVVGIGNGITGQRASQPAVRHVCTPAETTTAAVPGSGRRPSDMNVALRCEGGRTITSGQGNFSYVVHASGRLVGSRCRGRIQLRRPDGVSLTTVPAHLSRDPKKRKAPTFVEARRRPEISNPLRVNVIDPSHPVNRPMPGRAGWGRAITAVHASRLPSLSVAPVASDSGPGTRRPPSPPYLAPRTERPCRPSRLTRIMHQRPEVPALAL